MSFNATRKELGELYTFFRLLADGSVSMGTTDGKAEETQWPVALVQRTEHDGVRRYSIGPADIRVRRGKVDKNGVFQSEGGDGRLFPREGFKEAAAKIWTLLKTVPEDKPEVPEDLEAFLDALCIYNLEAQTEDRTDISLAFWNADAPLTGFSIRCRLAPMGPLLDGGRAANLKLEQCGIKFTSSMANKINALSGSSTEVADRMRAIERLGGVLKYADVADRVFRCNLSMIDLHFPRLLAEMVRLMHMEGIARVSDVTERIKAINPLKIKDELIHKHKFYEFKVKQLLLALALGMRPAKIYNGTGSAVEGMLLATAEGEVLCYHQSRRQVFADFLYRNTRLEKGNPAKDKHGFLEKENGMYYFKLNAKIGLLKR